jgi:hypothetical protein
MPNASSASQAATFHRLPAAWQGSR